MAIQFGAYENLYPAVYTDQEGWVSFNGKTWVRHNLADLFQALRTMTEAEYNKAFPKAPKPPES